MMTMLFILTLIAAILAWVGRRRSVILCLSIVLITSSILFYSDITTHLTISL